MGFSLTAAAIFILTNIDFLAKPLFQSGKCHTYRPLLYSLAALFPFCYPVHYFYDIACPQRGDTYNESLYLILQ